VSWTYRYYIEWNGGDIGFVVLRVVGQVMLWEVIFIILPRAESCISPVPFPTLPHAFRNSSARFGEYSGVDNAHGVSSRSVGGFWVVSVVVVGEIGLWL